VISTIDEIFDKYQNLEGVIMLRNGDKRVLAMSSTFVHEGASVEVLGVYFADATNEKWRVYTENDFLSSDTKISLIDQNMLYSVQISLTENKKYMAEEFDVSEIAVKSLYSHMHQHAVKILKMNAPKGPMGKEDFETVKKWGTTFKDSKYDA
jgi:hypothetical protein